MQTLKAAWGRLGPPSGFGLLLALGARANWPPNFTQTKMSNEQSADQVKEPRWAGERNNDGQ